MQTLKDYLSDRLAGLDPAEFVASQSELDLWISEGYTVNVIDEERTAILNEINKHITYIPLAKNIFKADEHEKFPFYTEDALMNYWHISKITLDLRNGEINAESLPTCSCSSDEFNRLILTFPFDSRCTSYQIEKFIDEHIESFQKVLALSDCDWVNATYKGISHDNYETVNDFQWYIEKTLINSDDFEGMNPFKDAINSVILGYDYVAFNESETEFYIFENMEDADKFAEANEMSSGYLDSYIVDFEDIEKIKNITDEQHKEILSYMN